MDASCAFACTAVGTRFRDLPVSTVQATKMDMLDYLGCVLGGSASAGVPEVVDLARDLGGRPEASVFVHGGKVGLLDACLANGAMAHALDYDSTHEIAHLHPSVSTISAALTLADQMGGVSGKDFLTSVALGTDMVSRLGLAWPAYPAGFIWTLVYGFFGCALAAGKLLALTEEQMTHALGLAYAQAAGNQQTNLDGAVAKRMGIGFAARGGVLSALMAARGITAARNALEGKRGLYATYNQGRYDPVALTDGIGQRFEGDRLSFKPYPTCRFNHGHIDAALALAVEHDLRAEEIEAVVAHVEREEHSQFDPLEVKRNPRTLVDAQFSMPYTVAVALVRRRMKIEDFTPEAIRDPEVIGVANKVSPLVDPSLDAHVPAAAVLEVRTRRGTFTKRVEYPLGHPLNPVDWADLADKTRDCATHAAVPVSSDRVEAMIALVARLETLRDMRELTALLREDPAVARVQERVAG